MTDPDQRDMDIKSLAGDAVDDRRGVRDGAHILAIMDRVGQAVFDERWAEATQLVDLHWPVIESLANALLSDPDLHMDGEELEAFRPV